MNKVSVKKSKKGFDLKIHLNETQCVVVGVTTEQARRLVAALSKRLATKSLGREQFIALLKGQLVPCQFLTPNIVGSTRRAVQARSRTSRAPSSQCGRGSAT